MTDILHLPGWKATATRHEGPELVIQADYIEPAAACIKCGVIGRLYRHGTKVLSFRDTPMHGKTVLLKGTAQRYRCRDCGETFVQPLTGVESDRRMTTRCVQFIRTQCLRDTFTRIAELVGCTEGTVRNIASDQIQRLDGEFTPYLPVEQQDEQFVMRPSPRRRMIAEKGNRCDGCGGIYDDEELRVCRTGVILDGVDDSGMSLYCSNCYVRFHTEGGLSGSHDSTHLCE